VVVLKLTAKTIDNLLLKAPSDKGIPAITNNNHTFFSRGAVIHSYIEFPGSTRFFRQAVHIPCNKAHYCVGYKLPQESSLSQMQEEPAQRFSGLKGAEGFSVMTCMTTASHVFKPW